MEAGDSPTRRWVQSVLEAYQPRLIRYAERITACQDLARDVVQYAFMRLCEVGPACRAELDSSGEFNGSSTVETKETARVMGSPSRNGQKTKKDPHRGPLPRGEGAGVRIPQWLYAVCRNRAIDLLRQQRKTTRLDDVAAELYRSPAPLPDAAAELSESSQVVRRMVRDLPAAQQEALDLWADGLSYREISAVTDKSEVNVRVIVHRAFRALREHALAESICDS